MIKITLSYWQCGNIKMTPACSFCSHPIKDKIKKIRCYRYGISLKVEYFVWFNCTSSSAIKVWTLKGYSQQWDGADLDTSFLTLKKVQPEIKVHLETTSIFAVFCLICRKNLCWVCFCSSYRIFFIFGYELYESHLCDMQINYEIVSNAHVRQLTVRVNNLIQCTFSSPVLPRCNKMSLTSSALRFTDHVTKRKGGSGDENGQWRAWEQALMRCMRSKVTRDASASEASRWGAWAREMRGCLMYSPLHVFLCLALFFLLNFVSRIFD